MNTIENINIINKIKNNKIIIISIIGIIIIVIIILILYLTYFKKELYLQNGFKIDKISLKVNDQTLLPQLHLKVSTNLEMVFPT